MKSCSLDGNLGKATRDLGLRLFGWEIEAGGGRFFAKSENWAKPAHALIMVYTGGL